MRVLKKITKSSLGFILALFLLGGAAWAATVTSVGQSPIVTPADPEQSSTIDQRIAQREAVFKTQLSGLNQKALAAKCTVAQSALTSVRTQDTAAYNVRLNTYQTLANQLATNIDRLGRQNAPDAKLNAAAAPFYGTINTFLSDRQNYKAALDDAITIDCAGNPVGFEASLLDARKSRAQLAADAAAVKASLPALDSSLADAKQKLISVQGGAGQR